MQCSRQMDHGVLDRLLPVSKLWDGAKVALKDVWSGHKDDATKVGQPPIAGCWHLLAAYCDARLHEGYTALLAASTEQLYRVTLLCRIKALQAGLVCHAACWTPRWA